MSQPIPRPPMQPDTPNTWIAGCFIGCVVVAAIGAVAVVLIAVFATPKLYRFFGAFQQQMAADFVAQYGALKEAGQVPSEHEVLFDDLMDFVADETSGFYAVLLAGGVVVAMLEDGELTDEEADGATALRDFLAQNPQAGFAAVAEFANTNTALRNAFESAQIRYGQGDYQDFQRHQEEQRQSGESEPAHSDDRMPADGG